MTIIVCYILSTYLSDMQHKVKNKNIKSCIYEKNIATDDKQIREDVALVKSYIKAHLSEKINLESLADMVFLSPGYLSLIFKQSTGDTVSHYIISQRIDEAKRLLETTNMKVNQICEKVGIDNVSYFGQQFKMFCGMSPSEYRKRKKFGGGVEQD